MYKRQAEAIRVASTERVVVAPSAAEALRGLNCVAATRYPRAEVLFGSLGVVRLRGGPARAIGVVGNSSCPTAQLSPHALAMPQDD